MMMDGCLVSPSNVLSPQSTISHYTRKTPSSTVDVLMWNIWASSVVKMAGVIFPANGGSSLQSTVNARVYTAPG